MALTERVSGSARWLVHHWLALYWLVFVLLALHAGRNPGFVMNPELEAYPWSAIVIVSAILALLTSWLGTVLRPSITWPQSGRLLNTIAFLAVLLCLLPVLVFTDGPGFAYIRPPSRS